MPSWPSPKCSPISPMLRTISTPGVSVGTRNIDIPWYALTSGSVTAMTMRKAEVRAFDEKNFHPSITHSSPSRRARVSKRVGSEPP